jgi:hypothetical protein
MPPWSPSGLKTIPHLQWGSHLANFFGAGEELIDLLVPFFKSGLDNNERCLWVTGAALPAGQARAALLSVAPDLAKREAYGQIEIVDAERWYCAAAELRPGELVASLLQREQESLALGYAGLRASGNCDWVAAEQWDGFLAYESLLQQAVRGRRLICLCSYCADGLKDLAHLDVMERHDMAVVGPRGSSARRFRTEPAGQF